MDSADDFPMDCDNGFEKNRGSIGCIPTNPSPPSFHSMNLDELVFSMNQHIENVKTCVGELFLIDVSYLFFVYGKKTITRIACGKFSLETC